MSNGFDPDCGRVHWFSQCNGATPPDCTGASAGQGCSLTGDQCSDCLAGEIGIKRFDTLPVDPITKEISPTAFVIGSAFKENDCDRRYIVCVPGLELSALGVLKGDELVAINGKPIKSRLEIPLLHHRAVGKITLEFMRGRNAFTVSYTD